MPERDYYEVLGVARDATPEQIKKAYRTLARKHHPDVNPGDKSAEGKFKEAQSAYDVLGDPEKRQRYDTFGHAAFEGMGAAGPRSGGTEWSARAGGPGFENVDFSQFFGGGAEAGEGGGLFEDLLGRFGGGGARAGRRSGPRKGQDLEAALEIPFVTAVLGGPTTITLARDGGAPEALDIRVPPGSDDGTRLRLKGRGAPGASGAPAGDLIVTLRIADHAYFTRDGQDLTVEVPITIEEAVLGAKVEVPTLGGGKVNVPVPAGTSSGQKLRVRGKGVPAHGSHAVGDLFVALKIVAPKGVDDESRRLIAEFADRNPQRPREGLW